MARGAAQPDPRRPAHPHIRRRRRRRHGAGAGDARWPSPHALLRGVGKEISLEDVRLALEKMAERFQEHPATILVLTNMHYAEAPWLAPATCRRPGPWPASNSLRGTRAAEIDRADRRPASRCSPTPGERPSPPASGNPIEKPPACWWSTARTAASCSTRYPLPRRRARRLRPRHRLASVSRPRRRRVQGPQGVAPLARSLAPGGRLMAYACGNDPGMEIVQQVWPGEDPFAHHPPRPAARGEGRARDNGPSRLQLPRRVGRQGAVQAPMHTLPDEIGKRSEAIGASTLFAAWNAATYNAQIEDHRLARRHDRGTLPRGHARRAQPPRRPVVLGRVLRVISRKRDLSETTHRSETRPCVRTSYIFTSESVSEGHPDKVADRISDTVVDAFLAAEPEARVACETLVTTNRIVLAGEVRAGKPGAPRPRTRPDQGDRDALEPKVRAAIKDIGYEQKGFHWDKAKFACHLHAQSAAHRPGRRRRRQEGRGRRRPGHHVRLRLRRDARS